MILEFIVFWNMPFFWFRLLDRHKVYRRRHVMDTICGCSDFLEALDIHAKQRIAAAADEYARKEALSQKQEQEQEQYIDYYMLHYRIMYTRLLADASVKRRYNYEFVTALTKSGKLFCEKCAQYNFHETDVQFCFHDSGTHCENCETKDKTLKNKL